MSDAGQLNRYSSRITQPRSQGASQAMLYATGLTPEDMAKPQVGIAGVVRGQPLQHAPQRPGGRSEAGRE
jgi:dihydroxyacid dehydratase/phosphogluconate dehydratase